MYCVFLFYGSNIILFLLIAYWFKHDLVWKNWEQLKENAPNAPILKNQNRDPGPLNLDNSTTKD